MRFPLFTVTLLLLAAGCSQKQPEPAQEPAPEVEVLVPAEPPTPPPPPPPPPKPSTRISLVFDGGLSATHADYITEWIAGSATGKPYSTTWISQPNNRHILTFWPVEDRAAFFASNSFITVNNQDGDLYSVVIDSNVFERFPGSTE